MRGRTFRASFGSDLASWELETPKKRKVSGVLPNRVHERIDLQICQSAILTLNGILELTKRSIQIAELRMDLAELVASRATHLPLRSAMGRKWTLPLDHCDAEDGDPFDLGIFTAIQLFAKNIRVDLAMREGITAFSSH